jgi:protein-disulfide isomerase
MRYVMRDFPNARLHPLAEKAHEAAHCAGEQKRYWEMHELLFAKSPDLTVPALKKYAVEVGLNAGQFDNCLDSDKYAKEVDREIQAGSDAGVRGTPSFFVGRSESGEKITGTMIVGAQPFENFKRMIDGILEAGNKPGPK